MTTPPGFFLNTERDVHEMLQTVGVETLDDLFASIPEALRLGRSLELPEALSELALTEHLSELVTHNQGITSRPCFLGGGCYDHFVPAIIDQLAGRGEFYTAYTPYQAEASQGTLQAIFEYQTLITQLTGMDVSNASLYDGGSAVAEAVLMAQTITKRTGRVVVAGSVHPEYLATLRTIIANLEPEVVVVAARHGVVEPDDLAAALDDQTAAVVLQHPNVFGRLESIEALVGLARARGALAIVSTDPISLGLLKRPASYEADIVVAEGQGLGNPLQYGGPYLGILACREAYLRKLPGRLVGETVDTHGRRCWVLTLQTREQHIRREKATSNICTNQGLLALRASIYLALMGPQGLRQVAELSVRKAHYAAERLSELNGLELAFPGAFFKEFVLRTSADPQALLDEVGRQGFHGGIALKRMMPEAGLDDAILVAVTEKRTKAQIDGLVEAYRNALHR